MGILISIDAGVGDHTAHAKFVDGKLEDAMKGLPVFQMIDLVVIERMQWRGVASKENVADLLLVAELVGEYKTYFEAMGIPVELVFPTTWKGNVPKEIHQPRILAKLSDEERSRIEVGKRNKKPNQHAVDAVGIGLWKLGRL